MSRAGLLLTSLVALPAAAVDANYILSLRTDVRLHSPTSEQVPGKVNSVRLSPEGLRFARPARLTMSYRNCLTVLLPKRIVYTTEGLQVLRVLPSLDLDDLGTVSSPLDHFSRYVVAY